MTKQQIKTGPVTIADQELDQAAGGGEGNDILISGDGNDVLLRESGNDPWPGSEVIIGAVSGPVTL